MTDAERPFTAAAVPANMNIGTIKPTDRKPCGIPSAVLTTGANIPTKSNKI